jgi:hypothetical protein
MSFLFASRQWRKVPFLKAVAHLISPEDRLCYLGKWCRVRRKTLLPELVPGYSLWRVFLLITNTLFVNAVLTEKYP